jgi:hypothetical protein
MGSHCTLYAWKSYFGYIFTVFGIIGDRWTRFHLVHPSSQASSSQGTKGLSLVLGIVSKLRDIGGVHVYPPFMARDFLMVGLSEISTGSFM